MGVFSPTAECYGVFALYRFRCVLGELGGFREGTGFKEPVLGDRSCGSGEPVPGTGSGFRWVPTGFAVPRNRVPDTKVLGSEGCVPEGSKVLVFDGFRRVRFCSRGLDGTGSGNQVPETRGIKKVPGSGDSIPKVPKVTFYFEGALLYFESL